MKVLFTIACLSFFLNNYSQQSLNGIILTQDSIPLAGAHIHSKNSTDISNESGTFLLKNLIENPIRLYISYIGYQTIDTLINYTPQPVTIIMFPESAYLNEVIVTKNNLSANRLNTQVVSDEFVKENYAGSLAKSLERLPGINAMEIGAGTSKPIIRGLGFNRVVVSENNNKHEGQQWGADHGLEIDALSVEEVEIIKNSGVIEYGSDAIGGVINIKNDQIPAKNSFFGEYTLLTKSVNNAFINALQIQNRKNQFFYKIKASTSDYGDYRLPTDTIVYLTVKMPVYNRKLKNTAGKERNIFGQIGYVSDNFQSILSVSNTFSKTGFFPGSHGIPSIDRVTDDGDSRNIEYPHQQVNHFKISTSNKWFLGKTTLHFSTTVQNNRRQEYSEFHTHFDNQEAPENNQDLELDFNLTTIESSLKWQYSFSNSQKINTGIQYQNQDNTIGGYGFLLPEYQKKSIGIYSIYEISLSERFSFNAGIRFDYATLKTKEFYDSLLFEYLINNGASVENAEEFATRSKKLSKEFSSLNFLTGLVYKINPHWEASFTTGTNFRLPTAVELAANGIHHGSFRHEKGNEYLDPEKGFVADLKVDYQHQNIHLSINPFVYYFSNYIFLKPSGTFSPLPHGGQIYHFNQSEALLSGLEFSLEKEFFDKWKTHFVFEYLYNQQLTGNKKTNYPLPFSPPTNGFVEVSYNLKNTNSLFRNTSFSGNSKFALKQDRIAQNEKITDGYQIFGLGIKSDLVFNRFKTTISLTANNIADAKYFNHTNFYRALEIPETGRNIQFMMIIPFGNAEK